MTISYVEECSPVNSLLTKRKEIQNGKNNTKRIVIFKNQQSKRCILLFNKQWQWLMLTICDYVNWLITDRKNLKKKVKRIKG